MVNSLIYYGTFDWWQIEKTPWIHIIQCPLNEPLIFRNSALRGFVGFFKNVYAIFNYRYQLFTWAYYLIHLRVTNCIPVAQVHSARATRPFDFFKSRLPQTRLINCILEVQQHR